MIGYSSTMWTRVQEGQAVQPGREEPPEAEHVARHVAEVAEEHVAGRDEQRHPQGEHVLDHGDHRDSRTVRRQSIVEISSSPRSGISPKAKPTTPAVVAATGSTIFGNWICLMSRSWATTEPVASVTEAAEPLPGQDRREDEERVVRDAVPARDDRDEDHVDDHLEQRVQHPPEVAQQGVRAPAAHVGLDEVAHEPASRPDIADALPDQRERTRRSGSVVERCRSFTRGGHRGEGYHLAPERPPSRKCSTNRALARPSAATCRAMKSS